MKEREDHSRRGEQARGLFDSVRRSFAEFPLLPTAVIGGFLVLAVVSFALDKSEQRVLAVVRINMMQLVFGSIEATSSLLSALVTGLITLTSITLSVLLLAVQQTAASLTSQVIGGSIAILLSVVVLYGLLLLIYVTVDQIRPVNIVAAIHDRPLRARTYQRRESPVAPVVPAAPQGPPRCRSPPPRAGSSRDWISTPSRRPHAENDVSKARYACARRSARTSPSGA